MNRIALLPLLALLVACARAPAPSGDDPASSGAAASFVPQAAVSARNEPHPEEPTAPSGDTGVDSIFGPPMSVTPSQAAHMPRVRENSVTLSNTGLPQVVVTRIVRQHFGLLRACYRTGLASNPGLTGAVYVQFTIRADGSTGAVRSRVTSVPDAAVVECVRRAFESMSFPSPSQAPLVVTYSVLLSPPDP